MQNPVPNTIRNNIFWVSPDRCLFWQEQNTLIIADMHLGKTGRIRNPISIGSGTAIPQNIYKTDLQRLMVQLYHFKVDRLIIAGDLTYSTANKKLDLFIKWRKDFSLLHIDWVKGNPDMLDDNWYAGANINVVAEKMMADPFLFIHDFKLQQTLTEEEKLLYTFSGHMHPAISIKGKGKQSLRFPCFYFAKDYCMLPAFSRFAGSYEVTPEKDDTVFAVVENSIVQMD